MKMTFQEIRIIATGPCIANRLRDVNTIYRYIDNVLSINNSRFAEFLPLLYPPELEFKETTDTASSDVSGNQNNCYWPLHSESIARCKHHMQEKLVYCCTCLENL
jgi:hypothetical protein